MAFHHSATITIRDDDSRFPYTLTMTPYSDSIFPAASGLLKVSDGNETMVLDSDMIIEMARAILKQRGMKTFHV